MRFTPRFGALLLALTVMGVSRTGGQDGEPIPEKELPGFLGPVSSDRFTWRRVNGPDFEVYYGKANPPLAGAVGFYFGGFPQDLKPGQTTVESRLGRFPVKWHRTTDADGSLEQEAIIVINSETGLRAHVWVAAPNENQLQQLLSILGQLPTFASGAIPDRFKELHDMIIEEHRIRRISWICWSTLLIILAWFADRFCRRRQRSAAFRLLTFAGVIALTIAATIAGVAVSRPIGMHWFLRTDLRLLLAAAGAICALALLAGLGLFIVRLLRTRTAQFARP